MKDNTNSYSDEWQPYSGDYDKFEYDIRLNDGREIWNCYPNARKFNATGGQHDGETFHEDLVAEIRFSQRPIMGINWDVSKVQQAWDKHAWVPIPDTGLKFVEDINDVEHFAGNGSVHKNVLYDFKFPEDTVLNQLVYKEDSPGGPTWIELGKPNTFISVKHATHVRIAEVVEEPKKQAFAGVSLPYVNPSTGLEQMIKDDTSYLPKGKKLGPTAKIVHSGGTLIKNKSTGRNEPCPCGSGVKFKKCCINK